MQYCINLQAKDGNTMWHMHITCWITKATNTHSEYVTLTAFLLQQWLHEFTQYYIIFTMPTVSWHIEKYSNISFYENLPSESQVVICGWTDRQTDHNEANSQFLQFSEHA